jgi:hypothetical protein
MNGICPVCCQALEVIESCADTLGVRISNAEGAKLCPESGKEFYEYLKAPSQ